MKHFLIIALAVVGVVLSAANVITDDMLSGKDRKPYCLAIKNLSVDEAKAQLDAVKAKVVASESDWPKYHYALAAAALYGREHQDTITYAQILEKFTEVGKEIGRPKPEPTDYYRVVLGNSHYLGFTKESVRDEALAANKDKLTDPAAWFEYAQLVYQKTGDIEQAVPFFRKAKGGLVCLSQMYLTAGESEKSAQFFWEAATQGKLQLDYDLNSLYQNAVTVEYAKADFDVAQFKIKLTRISSIYRIKARSWKPSKEGEVNPWLSFIGAIQDTIKDL